MTDIAPESGEHSLSEEPGRSLRFFDPWLVCDHKFVQVVMDNVIATHELSAPSRKRKRRKQDLEAFHKLARSLVANAAYALADGRGPPTIAVSLAKPKAARTRYDAPGLGQLPGVLEVLAGRILILRKSRRKGFASTIELTREFIEDLRRFKGFGLKHFHRDGGETIYLTRVDRNFVSDTRSTERIDYTETEQTKRLRCEVERINCALAAAQLDFEEDLGLPVAINKRSLRRIFNMPADPEKKEPPRFDLGGRLYGGWWQDLERVRRHGIRIGGERIADLDFKAMFLRLAYTRAGIAPPAGDLYAGIIADDLEGSYREGVKTVVNAMLFRTMPLQRLPKNSAVLLPPDCSGTSLRAAILRRHPDLAGVFETGIGMHLMKTESDLLVAILLRLIDSNIPALPMHDGLMVRHDLAERAKEIMADEAERTTGFRLPIKSHFL